MVHSDADGVWEVQVVVESSSGLTLPSEPGFVLFRAESDDLPGYLELANVARFALVVDGQRPAGSGEIRVTVSQAPELDERLGFLTFHRVGSTCFINRIGIRTIPADVTFQRLADGDYEVTAETLSGLQPTGPGLLEVLGAICIRPDYDGFERPFKVHRVSIRNGSVVDVSFVFGEVGTLPNGGAGPDQLGWRWSWFLAIVALAATGTLLTVLGTSRLRSDGLA